jgi:voltage-gated potassium channel
VLGAEGFQNDIGITLKEIVLKEKHPWVGQQIKDLDISRQTLIIMVRRNEKVLIPNGSLTLQTGDLLLIYTKKVIRDAEIVEL